MSSDERLAQLVAEARREVGAMGIGASKSVSRGIVLSFDALGTLYRFRAPVADQYLSVAKKCGLKSNVELADLESSFRRAYKAINTEFPNYGKGKLDDPEVWWTELVKRSFREVAKEEELPGDLGSTLYQHFSSGAAYELYPDVKPFLQRMYEIRQDPNSPTLLLGIITNSDPRVGRVLQSMSLKIGLSRTPSLSRDEVRQSAIEDADALRSSGNVQVSAPWRDYWNSANDFDFLTTSYDADSEKPDTEIFIYAGRQATLLALSKAVQELPKPSSTVGGIASLISSTYTHRKDVENMTWIHVGDEYAKDYVAAQSKGLQALHLVREGEGKVMGGVNTISSLTEVASIVNLMIQEHANVAK